MMRYEDTEELKDKSACAGLRADLKMCLLESDCCKRVNNIKDKKLPRECLYVTDGSVPEQCAMYRYSFFECKRSVMDNRIRFRGKRGY